MSGHEQERLSAYLDDELAPGERAQVADHIGACAECAARLAELAAVDRAAAALPSEAPQGYFDSFPARVRARLEPRAAPRRLPVWAWAAAAALLLAVVTPLTLLRRPPSPELAAREAVPEVPPTLGKGQPPGETRLPEPTREEPVAPGKREAAFAQAPSEADTRPARPAPKALPPAAPPLRLPETGVTARAQEQVAAFDEAATAEARDAAAPRQGQAGAERKPAARPADAAATAVMAPPAAADEPRQQRGRIASPAAGALASSKLDVTEAEWRRLDATRPATPAEWRRLREAWRQFAAREPDAPQADEARVRMIEAGREAWRTGGDAADEELFRSDAAAYLEREDATQKQRVRRLVR